MRAFDKRCPEGSVKPLGPLGTLGVLLLVRLQDGAKYDDGSEWRWAQTRKMTRADNAASRENCSNRLRGQNPRCPRDQDAWTVLGNLLQQHVTSHLPEQMRDSVTLHSKVVKLTAYPDLEN